MIGLSGIHYAETMARHRAREVERRSGEDILLAGVAPGHPLRARVAAGLIRLGTRLAPRPTEPPRRRHPSPDCC
jgi:hypothetical protein